jgi:mannose-1-phosphate guanylyltransferase
MPVLGVPLLEIWLQQLSGMGIKEILVNTSYRAETVERFLSLCPGHRPLVSREENLRGTAGTLFANRDFLLGDDALVIHADNLSLFAGAAFRRAFEQRPAGVSAMMMTFDTDAPRNCGIVSVSPAGIVEAMQEKVDNPPGHRANGAVYIFSREFLAELLQGPTCTDLSTEVIPRLMGRLAAYHNALYHRDIGSVDLYRRACAEALRMEWPFTPRAWPDFVGESEWTAWQGAWRKTGLQVQVIDNWRQPLAGAPDVVLIRQIAASALPALNNLAQARPGVSFIPWKVTSRA